MNTPTRILLVEPYLIVREGLRSLLAAESDLRIVGEAATAVDALSLVVRLQPHVILLELVGGLEGLTAIRQIRQLQPHCQVVVLTSCEDEQLVRQAIRAGAVGYWLKDLTRADLATAIRAAARGEPTLHPFAQRILIRQSLAPSIFRPDLTSREQDVIRLLTKGKSNKEIAATLHLTEGTIKGYVSKIFEKLEVADRTQAALYAVKHRLVLEA